VKKIRLIPRLDIKGENLIKGIHLEGLRVMGNPNEFAVNYYKQGADELILMDCVASLYGRNNLSDIISKAAKNIFIPITVGGGIRTVDDAIHLFRCGADKVAINTAAVSNPKLISDMAQLFGSQAVVLSVEAKKTSMDMWEVFTNNGREHTGRDVVDWIKEGVERGAGEVLLTSIDREGTRKGLDLELASAVTSGVSVPIILSGGFGVVEHIRGGLNIDGVDAVAIADALHYKRLTIGQVRSYAQECGYEVRFYEDA
jgi:cyclase